MITTIRITSPEEAKTAIAMIQAYLTLTTGDEPLEVEAERVITPAPKKKAPAKRVEKKEPAPVKVEKKEPVAEKAPDSMTTADLTAEAKAAVARGVDRGDIKKTVSTYGPRLSAVKVEDIPALVEELKAL